MNTEKFRALVHYIIARCDPSRLGATKLNKILWYVDTCSYRLHGESMTGEGYVKRAYGPVPVHILPTLDALKANGSILVNERTKGGLPMKEYVALEEPNTDLLSRAELELIDEISAAICHGHTAASISELTHDGVWAAANLGETIPMHAVLASTPGEITDEVLDWADSIIENAASTS
jgi:hypothetical protein